MILRAYTHTHTTESSNRLSLDVIERAQFVLCLDQGHSSTSSLPPLSPFCDTHSTVLVNRCLHGGGSEFNSGSRWFDSGVQVGYNIYNLWPHPYKLTHRDGDPAMELYMHLHIKMMVKGYQSVLVTVGELPCQWEQVNSEDPFAVAVMKGGLIVDHIPGKMSLVCSIFL